jgi:hypothetical protein
MPPMPPFAFAVFLYVLACGNLLSNVQLILGEVHCPGGMRTRRPISAYSPTEVRAYKEGYMAMYRDGLIQKYVETHQANSHRVHKYLIFS